MTQTLTQTQTATAYNGKEEKMANKKTIKSMEDQAAQLEQKAREMKKRISRLKREQIAGENMRAGEILRRFWGQGFAEADIEKLKEEIAGIFGPLPKQKGEKVAFWKTTEETDDALLSESR